MGMLCSTQNLNQVQIKILFVTYVAKSWLFHVAYLEKLVNAIEITYICYHSGTCLWRESHATWNNHLINLKNSQHWYLKKKERKKERNYYYCCKNKEILFAYQCYGILKDWFERLLESAYIFSSDVYWGVFIQGKSLSLRYAGVLD